MTLNSISAVSETHDNEGQQDFPQLYQEHLEPVYRYVRAHTPDDATADDLTAQIFFRALTSAASFRGEASYKSWVFQIARNTIATWRTKRSRIEIPTDAVPEEEDPDQSPVTMAIADEERDIVLELISELPSAQREVVHLRYWKDLTIDEIAKVTRRSTGAVRQLLHRAKARLRKGLSGRDLTALIGGAGASALAMYSRHRRARKR